MALIPAAFRPGIFKEASELGAGSIAAWEDGNLVRFWKGQPQPIGGWQQQTTTNAILGVPRNAIDWTALDGSKYINVGTHAKSYIYDESTYFDITPVRDSGSLGADPFTTTSGSSLVSVNDTAHGVTVGTYVRFGSTDPFNGVDMDTPGEYIVTTITDSANFIVESNQTALDQTVLSLTTGGDLELAGSGDLELTSTVSSSGGGASVTYSYDINVGSSSGVAGLGWGSDAWGDGSWGSSGVVTQTLIKPRTWALTNWGEDLIMNPRGGSIYRWDASSGTGTKAALIANAPVSAQFIVTSPHTRHLIAFGAHDGANDDPLFIRWCSQNDFDLWAPAETNTAGDHRVDVGSTLVSAVSTASGDIGVFTDTAMYIMQYIELPYIWGVELTGTNAGIISPGARASWADRIWWMGQNNFFVYDGRVNVLGCDVHSYVFDDLNMTQAFKFFATTNTQFQEITWYYVSADATEIDRYVSYNWQEKNWNIGNLDRTVWVDHSELFQQPYAFDGSGNIYTHEDPSVPPSGVFLESGAIEVGNGDEFMYTNRIIPDFERITGTVNITIRARQFPATDQISKGPYPLTSSTDKVDFRLRGRQTTLRLDSEGVDWRLSSLRLNARADGRR